MKTASNGNPALIVLSASLLMLAGCATSPTANERARPGATAAAPAAQIRDDGASFNGRLEVVVKNQLGRSVERATVIVESDDGPRPYRSTSTTNFDGRAAFSRVPRQVRVDVRYENSSYSGTFTLTEGGVSEMRVLMDIGERERSPQPGGLGRGF